MESIKISFSEPKYYIHPHKKTTTCVIEYDIKCNPRELAIFRTAANVYNNWPPFKATGVSRLREGDKYDENAGLSVARAMAETQAYRDVSAWLNDTMRKLANLYGSVNDFLDKSESTIQHNKEFVSKF